MEACTIDVCWSLGGSAEVLVQEYKTPRTFKVGPCVLPNGIQGYGRPRHQAACEEGRNVPVSGGEL